MAKINPTTVKIIREGATDIAKKTIPLVAAGASTVIVKIIESKN
ncbi:hypothetical protein [Mammaliicoccus sp. E-M26]|nr:hypothetical protein [Mammaliicoccus sp. E-M26]